MPFIDQAAAMGTWTPTDIENHSAETMNVGAQGLRPAGEGPYLEVYILEY